MNATDLAAAMAAGFCKRLDRSRPIDQQIESCLAAALQALAESAVAPLDSALYEIAEALEAQP